MQFKTRCKLDEYVCDFAKPYVIDFLSNKSIAITGLSLNEHLGCRNVLIVLCFFIKVIKRQIVVDTCSRF